MKLKQVLSRTVSQEDLNIRKHTPWIVSPLDEKAQKVLAEHSTNSQSQLNVEGRVLQFDETRHRDSDSNLPVFKHHKESSTVELFYDLFFVANLATFTANHEIRDVSSLKNYLGFFTLLWFTWLETSLFDVRFSSDSVFNRICKAVSFGVMTGFAISGSIYDTSSIGENAKAFRAMALILTVSRLALVAQYGVILWFVKGYKKTFLPLASTMAVLFIAAMIFLGTFWGFPHGKAEASFPIEHGNNIYVAWYVVVCCEAFAIIAISCIWRVVSFKHTHLVERIGLLTLIIMGEGIIGMTKSVSTILQNSSTVSGSDIGVVVAAVLLIYFVWVLYFDQIEHDRFGTIRQQIWAILHFPLHVALLLTVEGSTTLIIWNIISQDDTFLWSGFPVDIDTFDFGSFFETKAELIEYLRETTEAFASRFKEGKIIEFYNYTQTINEIENVKDKFASDEYDNTVGDLVYEMWTQLENSIFSNFDIEVPETKGSTEAGQNASFWNVFNTVWVYFYVAGGTFLIVLAIMYFFGKTHKSKGEYVSIVVRVVAGVLVALACIPVWYFTNAANDFLFSAWHIPIVMLVYFIVIVLDNLLVWHTNKTIAKQTSNNQEEYSMTDSFSKRGHSRERGSTEEAMPVMTREV